MSSQKTAGKQETAPATQASSAGKMTLGAYAKVTAADAVFMEEGEQFNLRSDISVETRGNEHLITAEFKDVEGKVSKARRRVSKAMLDQLAQLIEEGASGWHIAQKQQGEKGQYFLFVSAGA